MVFLLPSHSKINSKSAVEREKNKMEQIPPNNKENQYLKAKASLASLKKREKQGQLRMRQASMTAMVKGTGSDVIVRHRQSEPPVSKEEEVVIGAEVESISTESTKLSCSSHTQRLGSAPKDEDIKQLQEQFLKMTKKKKMVVEWTCNECQVPCIPVREESRCLCGHRLKDHPATPKAPIAGAGAAARRNSSTGNFKPFACTRCQCRKFFYIVAEGAWVLRCRCKHKHTDHEPGVYPHACKKPKCSCGAFDSPWVCNCNHPWASHTQSFVEKEVSCFSVDIGEELNRVQRTDLLAEPLQL